MSEPEVLSAAVCIICEQNKDSEMNCHVTNLGCEKLLFCATVYGHDSKIEYIRAHPDEVYVHERCRKKYTNEREVRKFETCSQGDDPSVPSKKVKLRSQDGESFNYRTNCLYCASVVNTEKKIAIVTNFVELEL